MACQEFVVPWAAVEAFLVIATSSVVVAFEELVTTSSVAVAFEELAVASWAAA